MATAEVVLHQGVVSAADFMPVFGIEQAVQRQTAMSDFIGRILKTDIDYGVIPGTNKEKVLKKPGAEKLCTFFGLTPMFIPEAVIEDWSGDEHGGEPLFYYRYKCQLWRGERLLAEAVGSCNSREKKYRYRNGERTCPECGKASIIKGKAEYGGGFICFAKKGGCGAKFKDDDQAIIGQEVGQVKNPDIADVVNTCQKIATKRALVAAVLIGTNASDSFTQDLDEEGHIDTGGHPSGTQAAADHVASQKIAKSSATQAGNPPTPASAEGRGDLPMTAPISSDPEFEKIAEEALQSLGSYNKVCSELLDKIGAEYGAEARTKVWNDAVASVGKRTGDRARRDVILFIYKAASVLDQKPEVAHAG